MNRSALTAVVLVFAVASSGGAAFAQGAPPGGSAKPPAAKPDKGKGDKPKDEQKPGAGNAAQVAFATEVMVLHATNGGKGIDPRIGNMPELKKPPFSSYDSYELVEKKRLPLDKNEQTMNLPNRRVLKTQLVEVLPDNDHVKLKASINHPGGKALLPLLEVKAKVNQQFIVAGPKHKNGILVLVFRVVK